MTTDLERADQLSLTLARTVKTLTALRRQVPSKVDGVEFAAVPLLFTLDVEPLRVSALAESVLSDVSTVSRQVAQLVEAGLLEKVADASDRRVHMVAVTDQGRAVIHDVRTRRAEWMQRLLTDWEPDDVENLTASLDRLREALVEDRDRLHGGAAAVGAGHRA